MMPPEIAARILFVMADHRFRQIEDIEARYHHLDGRHRSEIGAIRVALHAMGWAKDTLPETPFLDPDLLAAHVEARRLRRLAKQDEDLHHESRFTSST
jgi:hypothetical protein